VLVFIADPCSTKRDSTCTKTMDAKIVQNHIGSSLSTHLTSSTCVTVQSLHRLGISLLSGNISMSDGVITAARSRNLFIQVTRMCHIFELISIMENITKY